MSFPLTISEVTANWLSSVLHQPVGDIQVQRIGEGIGYLSEVFRVSWAPNGGPLSSVVVKLSNAQGKASHNNVYLPELSFYEHMKSSGKSLGEPACYHISASDDQKEFIIVMENLDTPYQCADQTKGLTSKEEILSALKKAAEFHALWWNKSDDSLKVNKSMSELFGTFINTVWEGSKPAFEQEEILFPELVATAEFLGATMKNYRVVPKTLVHGDYRADNMLIWRSSEATERPVVLVDFQFIHWGNPMSDIAYFFSNSVASDVLKNHQSEFIQYYWEALVANGVDDYTFDSCLQDYKEELIFAGTMPILSGASKLKGDELTENQKKSNALASTWRNRYAHAIAFNDPRTLFTELHERYAVNETEVAYPELDQDSATVLDYLDKDKKDWSTVTLEDYRKKIALYSSISQQQASTTEPGIASITDYDKTSGHAKIRVYLSDAPSGKVLLYVGSSWVGGADLSEANCRTFVKDTKCAVVLLHHSYAPECKHTTIIEECYQTICYLVESGDALGIPKVNSIAVLGERQGAHIIVNAIHSLADNNKTHYIEKQVLVSPWLDSSCNSATFAQFGDRYGSVSGTAVNKWHWNYYLEDCEKNHNPLYFSADVLKATPRTFIFTTEFDVTTAETNKYEEILLQNGVHVEKFHLPGAISVIWNSAFTRGREAIAKAANFIVA